MTNKDKYMDALKINAVNKTLEKTQVDVDKISESISKDCKACTGFFRIYIIDKNYNQKKYILYADVSSRMIPFNTKKLNFFCFSNTLLNSNAIIVEDNTQKFDGIIDEYISSISSSAGADIEQFVLSHLSWPSYKDVSKYVADCFDPISEILHMDINNQQFPLVRQIEKIETLIENQIQQDYLKSEIESLKKNIQKYYSENLELATQLRKISENYNFFKNS